MNIMELGALGEFFGSIGVIITLGYLAVQVRGNARAPESQVHANLSTEMERLAVAFSQDDALIEAMMKATRGEDLTDMQRAKLSWWFGGFLRVCESHILQRELRATKIELEKPVAVILRQYFRTEFFRELITASVENGTATDEFNNWLESEILNSHAPELGDQGDHLRFIHE
jgi:hypothetical protein